VWYRLMLVAVGGGLGASARYLTSVAAARLFGAVFPVGTLAVNLVGCLLIGVGFSLAERAIISPGGRLFFMTGVLGGLTTFSTYALETVTFFEEGARGVSLMNVLANNVAGVALVLLGLWAGRAL
jgi:fluoride exporter